MTGANDVAGQLYRIVVASVGTRSRGAEMRVRVGHLLVRYHCVSRAIVVERERWVIVSVRNGHVMHNHMTTAECDMVARVARQLGWGV